MRARRAYLLVLLLLLLGVRPTWAATTYTISPGESIAAKLAIMTAGDTLLLHGGNYNQSVTSGWPSGTSWNNPITIASVPGETAVIYGVLAINEGNLGIHKYVILRDFVLDGTNNGFYAENIFFYVSHVRVQRLEVRNCWNSCIAGFGTGHEFLNNVVHHQMTTDCANGCRHGFYFHGDNGLFDGNDVYDMAGYGMQFYSTPPAGGQDDVHDNIVRNNRIHDNSYDFTNPGGLTIGGLNNQVYNNVIYNNRNGASGIDIQYGTANTKVYHNTVYGNSVNGIDVAGGSGAIIRNNIAYGNASANYLDYTGRAIQDHNVFTNPGFVNAGAGQFQLSSGSSPAVDAGTPIGGVAGIFLDADNHTRPVGGWDAGAYEFGSGGVVVTPPPDLHAFYVSAGGHSDSPNDGNPCTGSNSSAQFIATPKRTIASAASCLGPGDTLYIRGGSYTETLTTQWTANGTSWSAGGPITITSYQGEAVTVVGTFAINQPIATKYMIFQDFTIDASAGGFGANAWFLYANYVRLQRLELKNYPNMGLFALGTGIEILNNTIHHTLRSDCPGGDCTHGMLLNSLVNSLVDGNNVYDNSGYGIWMDCDGCQSGNHDTVLRNNKVHHNGFSAQPGGMAAHGTLIQVYNNLIYANGSGAVGLDLSVGAVGTVVAHNTIYGNSSDGIRIGPDGSFVTVYNNLLVSNGGQPVSNASGNTTQAGNVTTAQLFASPGTGDFHLQTGSSAIDAGIPLTAPPGVFVDLDTHPRPVGGWDAGAYEYSSAVVATGVTYYVSGGGHSDTPNNSNPCAAGANSARTITTPKLTIAAGVACAVPGDTVYVRGGVYNEGIGYPSAALPSGTSFAPGQVITIAGYPGETPQVLTINIQQEHYLIFDHFRVEPTNTGGDKKTISVFNFNGTDTPGDAYVRFQNLEVLATSAYDGMGVEVWGNHTEFLNVTVHDTPFHARSHCYYILGAFNTVRGGRMYSCGGYGVQVYTAHVNGDAHDNVIDGNVIYNNGGSDNPGGIIMGKGANNLAYNNLIYGNISVGTDGSGIDIGYNCNGCAAYQNTIYGNNGYCITVDSTNGTVTGAHVSNNICAANGAGAFTDTGVGTVFSGNACSSAGAGCAVVGAMNFVNAGTADFRLQAGSVAINAGVPLPGVPGVGLDFAGNVRPVGGWDAGAYEFGGVSPPPTRPTGFLMVFQ